MNASSVNSWEDAPQNFGPCGSLKNLRLRSALLRAVRQFFDEAGFWEVETPLVSADTVIDLHLEPFRVSGRFGIEDDRSEWYLQTSPEFAMKRMLAAGAGNIYQITRAFRQDEFGPMHNPEYTILEWYSVDTTLFELIDQVQQLCRQLFSQAEHDANWPVRFERISYREAFQQAAGIDPFELSAGQLRDVTIAGGFVASEYASNSDTAPDLLNDDERKDEWLNVLLATVVEPWLKTRQAVFVYDYPVSQAALARVNPDDPRVAERFELYLDGVEICNGYHELTDAEELLQRNRRQNQLRVQSGLPALPEQSRLIHAMQAGLPDCSGVAVGLDRLIMLAIGAERIDEVLAFPADRA